MTAPTDLKLRIQAVDGATGPLARIRGSFASLASSTAAWRGRMGGAFGALGTAGKTLGGNLVDLGGKVGGLLALGGVAGFTGLIHGAVEAGGELQKMSERLGVSATWYATYSKAAEVAEVSQETFADSLTKLTKNWGEAKAGGGEALKVLNAISPAFARQFQHAQSAEEAFTLLTKAMGKVPDEGRRLHLATAVMGKGAIDMAHFMGQGITTVNGQAAAIKDLIGDQEDFAASADDAGDEMLKAKMAFEGLTHAAASGLLPAIRDLAINVREYFGAHRQDIKVWAEGAGKAISDWVANGGLSKLGDGLGRIAAAAGWVVDKLGPLGAAVVVASPVLLPLASGLWGVAAALGGLVTAAGLPLAPVLLASAAVLTLWANWEHVKDLPILAEIDALVGAMGRMLNALNALKQASGLGPDDGTVPGGEETLTSEPLTRAQVEQQAQAKALRTVGRGVKAGLAEGAATAVTAAVPGVGLLRAAGQAVKGWGVLTGGAPAGAATGVPTGAATGAKPGSVPPSAAPAPKAEILVSFANPPKGLRTEVASSYQTEVDLATGPTMSGP